MITPSLTEEERIFNFQTKIIERRTKDMTWIETIAEYCEDSNVDHETVAKLISPWLKTQLTEEALRLKTITASYDDLHRVGL